MEGIKILAILYCFLEFIAICYLAVVLIFSKRGEFEFWLVGNFIGILFTQAVASLMNDNKLAAYVIGFGTVPLIIVSCVMGYFYFYHFSVPDVFSFQKSSFTLFLTLSFVVMVVSSMIFISRSVKSKKY